MKEKAAKISSVVEKCLNQPARAHVPLGDWVEPAGRPYREHLGRLSAAADMLQCTAQPHHPPVYHI